MIYGDIYYNGLYYIMVYSHSEALTDGDIARGGGHLVEGEGGDE